VTAEPFGVFLAQLGNLDRCRTLFFWLFSSVFLFPLGVCFVFLSSMSAPSRRIRSDSISLFFTRTTSSFGACSQQTLHFPPLLSMASRTFFLFRCLLSTVDQNDVPMTHLCPFLPHISPVRVERSISLFLTQSDRFLIVTRSAQLPFFFLFLTVDRSASTFYPIFLRAGTNHCTVLSLAKLWFSPPTPQPPNTPPPHPPPPPPPPMPAQNLVLHFFLFTGESSPAAGFRPFPWSFRNVSDSTLLSICTTPLFFEHLKCPCSKSIPFPLVFPSQASRCSVPFHPS